MYAFKSTAVLALLALILSCSAKHENAEVDAGTQAERTQEEIASDTSQPKGVLSDAQTKTLEKANQVGDLLQQANEKRLKEMDE